MKKTIIVSAIAATVFTSQMVHAEFLSPDYINITEKTNLKTYLNFLSSFNPMKTYPEFKEKFIERYSKLTNFKKFKEYSTKQQLKSIRTNTLKML